MLRTLAIFLLFFSVIQLSLAQDITINGRILDENGNAVPGVTVQIKRLNKGAITGPEGHYSLKSVPPGEYDLSVSSVGYKKISKTIIIQEEKTHIENFNLEEDVDLLDDVLIVGESEKRYLKKQPYNLNVIDTRPVKNSNLDVSQVLGKSTGIHIREEGGLGSDLEFSIHGLSGKQVRFFMDGIPMDNFGAALSINNIPVNLVERVEVYKGLVPVWLGSDALGGAVNIITDKGIDSFLDVSYSFGSFNTHRSALNGKYTHEPTGLVFKTSAFYNYSNNDYQVDVEIPDELGNLDGTTTRVRRFHDDYRSGMIQLEVGMENKSYADQLYTGITFSGNRDNVQHGVSMDRVFGQIYTRDQMFMPFIKYRKDNFLTDNLSIQSYASFINGNYLVADTSSRTYDWLGNYKIKNNPAIGESRWEKTLFTFDDHTTLAFNNLYYTLNEKQQLIFNHTFTRFQREGDDPLDPNIVPFSDPNYLNKNVLGLSYNLNFFDQKFSATLFSKYYLFDGKAINVDWDNEKSIHLTEFRKPGYGIAGTWFILKDLQFKASFENTYRLPEGYEIFGDGLLVLNNPLLQPEKSNNLNAGMLYHKVNHHHSLSVESNYFYRGTENLIRVEATGINSQYVNLAKATSSGVEGEINYKYKDRVFVSANLTYQNIINKSKYDEDRVSNVYLDRIPNIPYLFGNLSLGLQWTDLARKEDHFSINWSSRFIHEYFLKWPSQGDPDNKHIIPGQHIHNLEFSYSVDKNRYNLSLGSTNLFDSRAYDKFRVQKPGRACYFKLRYFITRI